MVDTAVSTRTVRDQTYHTDQCAYTGQYLEYNGKFFNVVDTGEIVDGDFPW